VGHAKDPISSGLSLEAFLPEGHWIRTGAEAMVLGAGGSSIAVTCRMMDRGHGANRPSRIIVTNRSPGRLADIRDVHRRIGADLPVEYHHAPDPRDNDALMNLLKPRSLVINATGLGKDAPGSPVTAAAVFPRKGFAWDFNYRGELVFLEQARAQRKRRSLTVEDGWVYFIHGWTQVIAEVFHIDIPPAGREFDRLCDIAAAARR
jgi:shikimate 5-dehydrogenase